MLANNGVPGPDCLETSRRRRRHAGPLAALEPIAQINLSCSSISPWPRNIERPEGPRRRPASPWPATA